MTTEKFTMNIDSEMKKTLKHIGVNENSTVTNIIISLIENFIELYDEEKNNFQEAVNFANTNKCLNRNGIEIDNNGITFTESFFNGFEITNEQIADYFNERAEEDSHIGLTIQLK